VAEFEIFVNSAKGVFTKEALNGFYAKNQKSLSEIADQFTALDGKVTVTLNPISSPLPRFNQPAWSATTGGKVADKTWKTIAAYYDLLVALERIFDPSLTGAFEVALNRLPKADMVFPFATKKFAEDHICDRTATKPSKMKASAEAVGKRRLITPAAAGTPAAFTNIPVSTTMVLSQKKYQDCLKDEVDKRQKEYQAIYDHLTSHNTRLATLMEGDHEEVIFTSLDKYQMYEVQKPATATTAVNAESRPEQHLRYAVQKVATKWLVHHMAGRCTAQEVNVAPGGFAAFDYTQLENIPAQSGTFRKTS
jgi:hypothetical protein